MNKFFMLILSICIPCANASPASSIQLFITENNMATLEAENVDFVEPKKGDSLRQHIVSQGKKVIGTPYHWGGTTVKGFDCSGLVYYLYKKNGFKLPRTSRAQFNNLTPVKDPQPGDLVFFKRNGRINHVGLYIGDGKMLHSPRAGEKVRIENIEKPRWQRRYAGARRVLTEKNNNTVVAKTEPVTNQMQLGGKSSITRSDSGQFIVK